MAFVRVLYCCSGHRTACSGTHGAKFETANIQCIKRDKVSFANFTEYIFCGNFYVFKKYLACGGSFNTHFIFFRPEGKSFHVALHNESGEFFAGNFGKNDKYIRKTCVGYPHFLSVQHIMCAIGTQIGARLGI